ncbi:MAG: phosphotransferase family protein [Desulfatibacillaceae bacterium]
MTTVDKATEIREGEELDAKAIEKFLKERIPDLSGPITIKQFPSGFSNLTYSVTIGDREMVLRRPPHGRKAKTAHDMGREFRVLSALKPVYPYCPNPLVYTEDTSVIGAPFYVMDRIQGIILRRDLPEGLDFTEQQARKLCEELLDVHVALHKVDYKAVGLKDFGKPQGYVGRQVRGWSERYRAARTDDAPSCEKVMDWLLENMPKYEVAATVIHNDYKFDNVVLDPENPLRIIGVLDWEMCTIGDPLMDLGSSIAYWVQGDDSEELQAIRMMPTNIPGALTRKELVQRYLDETGLKVNNFDFYYVFGLFRLAGIAQQIYYRYYHGQTRDERFAQLIFVVHILDKVARQVMAGDYSFSDL